MGDWHEACDQHGDDADCDDYPTSDYIPAKNFVGAKPGMVFKCGRLGVGYDRDLTTVPVDSHPRVLCLDALIQPPRNPAPPYGAPLLPPSAAPVVAAAAEPTMPHEHPSNGVPRRRRARRRMKSAQFTVPCETEAADGSWKQAGLWAVDSVNANSWAGALSYLERSVADAVLAQEVRRTGTQVQGSEREAQRGGSRTSLQEADKTEAGGTTAGLAVAVRRHIGLARLGGATADAECGLSSRVHARWMGGIVRGGIHLITAWPHHTEGPSPRNLDLLDQLAQVVHSMSGPWIIGADWNMDPCTLAATGWLDVIDGVAVIPNGSTCGAACLDYFVVPRMFAHAIAGISVIGDAGFHPHKPVRLYIKADARALKVRRLRAPRPFPTGAGPAGCLPEAACRPLDCDKPMDCDDADGGDCSVRYRNWLKAVEGELVAAYGLDNPRERSKHAGRAEGPRFVWQCALGQDVATPRYSSAESRKWRVVAACARDIAISDDLEERSVTIPMTVANTAARAIRRLSMMMSGCLHGSPAACAASQVLMASNAESRRRMAEAARHKAQLLERNLATRRKAEWESWLKDGPNHSLGRQHRFSRVQTGWIPTKIGHSTDGGSQHDPQHQGSDQQHLGDTNGGGDGLGAAADAASAAAPAARVIKQSTNGMAPLDVQGIVDDQAAAWAEHWAVGRGMPTPQWPDDIGGRSLGRPTVGQLRAALRTFPVKTALAWDALHPRSLLRLSDARLNDLIDVLMQAEKQGAWPETVGVVSVVLLPKPDGGWRPIGLFPTITRVWMRLRRNLAQAWEVKNSRDLSGRR